MTESLHSSTSVLHKRWVELEDENHELALAIDAARTRRAADLAPMRERQARLLLDINSLVAEIRDAPATRKTSAPCLTSRSSTKLTLHATSLSTDRRIFQ